ncbi:plexin-B-like [Pollicipes pollicipes]|uniref:plexin-B-like n=1 Tax=Pollicipes pollicipes TaxID=41117 RepID=UPI001884B451|nr:plexin-B-like [Pollicipes pollicipes]
MTCLGSFQVALMSMQTCEEYTNCAQCLEPADPYCGWCSLEKRCTVRSECKKALSSSPRWLTIDAGQQCIDMEKIEPSQIAVNQPAEILLTIRALPPLPAGAKYLCVFGTAPPVDAAAAADGLRCRAPPVHLRPSVPLTADHVTVPLSVRSSETSKDFVTRQFAYFDCSHHTRDERCSDCHGAPRWQSPAELGCPAVVQPRQSILVPSDVSQSLVLEVRNLPPPLAGQASYTCVIVVEGRTTLVPARVDAKRFVVCDRTRYYYHANSSLTTATVIIKWNYTNRVDAVNITLYKCSLLATHRGAEDCSLCLTRDPRYRCAWCEGTCRFGRQCAQSTDSKCPKPQIRKIHPRWGPLEGGTLLTIEGRNLGLRRSEVNGRIFVGRAPCVLVEYEVSVRVVCRTGAVASPSVEPVKLGSNAGFTVSTASFEYKRIDVVDVHPRIGPLSGGTLLTLTGTNLHIGSNVTVTLGGRPCHMTARTADVKCLTSAASKVEKVNQVVLVLDAARRKLHASYEYSPDPSVLDIKPLKSYASGGRLLTVHGRHLDSVQAPRMIVFNETHRRPINSTLCRVLSSELMECASPAVPRPVAPPATSSSRPGLRRRSAGRQTAGRPRERPLQIGFLMDGVQTVRDLHQFAPDVQSTIVYVDDPQYLSFANGVRVFGGNTLVIEGRDLSAASDERDTAVTVGGQPCNVTSLTASQLVCVPPQQQPAGQLGADSSQLPDVVVSVGNLRFTLGRLVYEEQANVRKLGADVIGGIAAGAAVLVLASLLILFVYRRKSSQVEREYKRIQIQMDTLENNIRSECKQAFAAMCTWDSRRGGDPLAAASPDLQAQLNSLAASFNPDEVDCLDQREFLIKVLFPGIADHPILKHQSPSSPTSPRTTLDVAMLQLEQLVRNPNFLVAVIDTMEQQKDFSIRDRVTVASLLTVILMTNMEYMTTVLHQLLVRHISRISRSKHPHLMLRRTETVMEKLLTNWISVCLHGHIRDRLSSPLYLLTKAIKHQMSCGPVDAVTLEAHYSLAEERLLRQQVEHNSVTLMVTTEETPYERIPCNEYQGQPRLYEDVSHKVTVHALDCDSISQVKQKVIDEVFCGLPASQRPSHHCVALEWYRADGQRSLLADEDATSKAVDGWRQINTSLPLRHLQACHHVPGPG